MSTTETVPSQPPTTPTGEPLVRLTGIKKHFPITRGIANAYAANIAEATIPSIAEARTTSRKVMPRPWSARTRCALVASAESPYVTPDCSAIHDMIRW